MNRSSIRVKTDDHSLFLWRRHFSQAPDHDRLHLAGIVPKWFNVSSPCYF
jgi:hypothetical protein